MPKNRSITNLLIASGLLMVLAVGVARQTGHDAKASPPSTRPATPATAPAAAPPSPDQSGSTRNSRVAYPMPAGQRLPLVFLAGEMSEDELKELNVVAPNVRIIAGLNRQTALAHAREADGIDIRVLSPELLKQADKLVWVQALSAGVDRIVQMEGLMTNDRIALTNMRAVHGPAIADHAFAMLLSLTRNLHFYEAAQSAGRWEEQSPATRSQALSGLTMLVVGIGGIGSEIAQRAHGFGMRVIATRRSDAPAPDYVERVGKPDDLLAMLPEADVVAVCVPLTKETERMFDGKEFAAMKKGAYLINIARGRIVDTSALVDALRNGKLSGACLDVTDPEPLPPDHPLWKLPNVIITPHTAADADVTEARRRELFRENMRRFGAGEPLLNVVDKKAGY
jgi:phosphoglycerate dehydrogenase-like enzyme